MNSETTTTLSQRDAYKLMLKEYPDVMDIAQMCQILDVSTKTGYRLILDDTIVAHLGDVPLYRSLRGSDAVRDFLHGWRDTGLVRVITHELLDSCHKGLVFASHAKFLLNETRVSFTS